MSLQDFDDMYHQSRSFNQSVRAKQYELDLAFLKKKLPHLLTDKEDASLLDFGCSDGQFMLKLSEGLFAFVFFVQFSGHITITIQVSLYCAARGRPSEFLFQGATRGSSVRSEK